MILPIHVYGSDVLRANAQEIDFATYEGLQELIANMQETMERADGVGIAAPQVGVNKRMFAVNFVDFLDEKQTKYLWTVINPEIVEKSVESVG